MDALKDPVILFWLICITFAGAMIFRIYTPEDYKARGFLVGALATLPPPLSFFLSGLFFADPSVPAISFFCVIIISLLGTFMVALALDKDSELKLRDHWMKAWGITLFVAVLSVIPLSLVKFCFAFMGWNRP